MYNLRLVSILAKNLCILPTFEGFYSHSLCFCVEWQGDFSVVNYTKFTYSLQTDDRDYVLSISAHFYTFPNSPNDIQVMLKKPWNV